MPPRPIPTRVSSDELAPSNDDPGLVTRVYRTVTPAPRGHEDGEMNAIGWGILLGLLVLLVPLLPFVAIVWAVGKVIDALTPGNHT